MPIKAECAWEISAIILQSSDMKIDVDLSLEEAKQLHLSLTQSISTYEDLEDNYDEVVLGMGQQNLHFEELENTDVGF